MEYFGAVLFLIYMAAGYWATGKTIYYNKIVVHQFGQLFWFRLVLGTLLGWILIPWALIAGYFRSRR